MAQIPEGRVESSKTKRRERAVYETRGGNLLPDEGPIFERWERWFSALLNDLMAAIDQAAIENNA